VTTGEKRQIADFARYQNLQFDFSPDVRLHILLEAVLNCLFEGLRVKNFSFDRFFQGR